MEEQLKSLLIEIQKNENLRNNEIEELESKIESVNRSEQYQIDNLLGDRDEDGEPKKVGGIYADRDAGLYNHLIDSEFQKLVDEEKNNIMERYKPQREELKQKLEQAAKQNDEEKQNNNKKIATAIKEYHLEMVLAANTSKSTLSKIDAERDLKMQETDKKIAEKEAERNAKIEDIDRQIAEKEAKRAHLVYFNNIESKESSLDIDVLTQDIKKLNLDKDELSTEEIDNLKAEKASISDEYTDKIEKQKQTIQYYDQQRERAAKLIGTIRLSEKSVEEIYQILFDDKENEVVNEIEEPEQIEQPEASVEAPVIEEDNQENTTQNEEEQVDSASNQELSAFWKKFLDKNTDQTMGVTLNSRNRIIKDFMKITGIKENEAAKIFEDEKHSKAIGQMATSISSREELFKAMQDYYISIDSKLDIEVSSKGIRYNDETIEPEEIVDLDDETKAFVKQYTDTLDENLLYDENIIQAIVLDNSVKNSEGKIRLTLSGSKKLEYYIRLVKEPTEENKEKCSVKYDLTKMTWFDRVLKNTGWTKDIVEKFKEVAYKAKDSYAKGNVTAGPITNAIWFVKDMLKNVKMPKLGSGQQGEEELNNEENTTTAHQQFVQQHAVPDAAMTQEEVAQVMEENQVQNNSTQEQGQQH